MAGTATSMTATMTARIGDSTPLVFIRSSCELACAIGRPAQPWAGRPSRYRYSLALSVPRCSFPEALFVLGRQLRPVDSDGQLVELAGELERHLVVPVIHRSAGVRADVEGLVPLQDKRHRALHFLRGHHLPVDLQHPGAALADAAQLVEGQRREAQPVVFEGELARVLAGRERLRALPAHAL